MSKPLGLEPPPQGPATMFRIVDGEWLFPDLTEKFNEKLVEKWKANGGDPLEVIVYIRPR